MLLDSMRAVVLVVVAGVVLLAPLVARVAHRDRDLIGKADARVDETSAR